MAIVDTLVSPGGDPWKREQTHDTLARYLLEEAYEAYDAIGAHDLTALKEELGDVLLQVVLHARLAQEADEPWSIDDVAQTLSDKLIRRNPHVFAGVEVSGLEEITANWERIKREEKAGGSVLDGVAPSQPALGLADAILTRARSAGIDLPLAADGPEVATEDELGEFLLALVARASERGLDAEGALRRVALRAAQTVRAAETVRPQPPGSSGRTDGEPR